MLMHAIYIHLISDSTGETLHAVARILQNQYKYINVDQYSWPLTRTLQQVDDIFSIIKIKPGIVLCTVMDEKIQSKITNECAAMNIPCISALNKIIQEVLSCINKENIQHTTNITPITFNRAEAIDYTIAHDDGQMLATIDQADIIIIGASRTAKTPTSVYLAYRGYKVANIPFILTSRLPQKIFKCTESLIVGLTLTAERLLGLRQSRAVDSNLDIGGGYTSLEVIGEELRNVHKICKQNNWPIIDASKKSVEEIAAVMIKYHNKIMLSR